MSTPSAPAEASDPTESARGSVRANSIWLFAGNMIYSACQWGLLAVLAKLGTPETVGAYAAALAVATPVMLLASLQLRGLMATDARRDFRFRDYFALRLGLTGIALAALAIVSWTTGRGPSTAWLLVAVALTKAIDSIHDVYYGRFQQQERTAAIAWSLSLRGVAGVALAAVVFRATGSVVHAVAAMGGAWVGVLLLHDVPRAARLPNEDGAGSKAGRTLTAQMRRLFVLALPMGGVLALASLSENVPLYVIERFIGVKELGFFAASAALAQLAQRIVSAVSRSAAPRLAALYQARDLRGFEVLYLKMLGVGVLVGGGTVVIVALFGEAILRVFFTSEYAAHASVLLWLVVLAVLRCQLSTLGTAVTSMRQFNVQFVLHLTRVVLVAGLSVALVGTYGMNGVIAAMFAATVFLAASYAVVVRRSLSA